MKTLEEHNEAQELMRPALAENAGVVCNKCHTEMRFIENTNICVGISAKGVCYPVACPNCWEVGDKIN